MPKNIKEIAVTCGVIVTDTRGYLICHPTHSKWWDLPKGRQDPGETYVQTAMRELREETGITVSENQLSYLGIFDYKPEKRLALFYHQVDTMYNPKVMNCISMVNHYNKPFPEMDSFKVVNLKTMLEKVSPNMQKVLSKILKN